MSAEKEDALSGYGPKDSGEHLLWKELDRTEIADCRIFKVLVSRRLSPKGDEVKVALIKAPDWVCVVPLVKKDGVDHCLMVRQFRQGAGEITYEFPAGTMEEGEAPEAAAARELLEETGAKGRLTLMGQVNPNPAMMTNTQYLYAAEDLEFSGVQNLDENENVEYFLLPLDLVKKKMGIPPFTNGTMMSALAYFLRWRGDY
jgi:8-oxo-dGTP pyrophosphatase MutT (NUDIX family)